MRDFFQRASDANLTINLSKGEFCKDWVICQGNVVGQGQVRPIDAKGKAFSHSEVYFTVKDFWSPMGVLQRGQKVKLM